MNKVVSDAGRILGVIPECFESIAIKAIQTIFCAKPKKAPAILQATNDGIVRQPVFHLVVPEIVRLANRIYSREKNNGKKYRFLFQVIDLKIKITQLASPKPLRCINESFYRNSETI